MADDRTKLTLLVGDRVFFNHDLMRPHKISAITRHDTRNEFLIQFSGFSPNDVKTLIVIPKENL